MMKHFFFLHFFLQVVLSHVMGTEWSVNIPRQLRTSSGDCVVIPCSYTLPASERYKPKEIIWYQQETQKIILHSNRRGQNFKATLIDDFKIGNCTLWIKEIAIEDSMMYRFLIELPGVRNYSSTPVDLRVSRDLANPELQVSSENVVEGDTMIMTCMTNHSCNMRPPSLVWNHVLGEISTKTVDLQNGIWQFVSTQNITASSSHNGLTVYCQTKYMRINRNPNSRNYTMKVLYSPKNTTITVNASDIREGDNVSLWCSSQSNPEVSQYIWNGITDDGTLIPLTGNQTTLQILNIKPNLRSVYCTAQNAVGIHTSPVVDFDFVYDNTKYLVIAGGVGIAALVLAAVTLKLLLGDRKNKGKREEGGKAKSNDYHFTKNPYEFQPHCTAPQCSACESSEFKSVYGNVELNSVYGNTEFVTKDKKEIQHSMEPKDHYAMYECPTFEEEPGSFDEELDSFEEESVYANT